MAGVCTVNWLGLGGYGVGECRIGEYVFCGCWMERRDREADRETADTGVDSSCMEEGRTSSASHTMVEEVPSIIKDGDC